MSSILISGGTVVSASGTLDADVLVEGEKIAMVLCRQPGVEVDMTLDRIIDATGKYVLPGLINAHAHLQEERGGKPQPLQYELINTLLPLPRPPPPPPTLVRPVFTVPSVYPEPWLVGPESPRTPISQ